MPAAAPAWPNACDEESSRSQPSSSNAWRHRGRSSEKLTPSGTSTGSLSTSDSTSASVSCRTVRPGTAFHDPSRALQADAVDHPDAAHQRHPADEGGEGDEEAEAGAEVGGEDEVDRAHQHADGDDDDEDAAQLGLPADGEQVRGGVHSQAPHVFDDGLDLLVGEQRAEAGHATACPGHCVP